LSSETPEESRTSTETETSKEAETSIEVETSEESGTSDIRYILNTNSKKIHKPTCGSVKSISDANRKETSDTLEELLEQGYTTCGNCFD
jgi:DNA-entry nuclease